MIKLELLQIKAKKRYYYFLLNYIPRVKSRNTYIFYAISVGKQPGVVSLPGAGTFNDGYKIEDCSKKVSTES